MRILAVDTCTDACSAALLQDDVVTERFLVAPRRHTELLLPMIDELLAEAGVSVPALDAIAFGAGPGAFTGLRIAAACAQGIALAHAVPVVPISSLAALAQGIARGHAATAVIPALDARMGEVYIGRYRVEDGLATAADDDRVCPPQAVPVPGEGLWTGAGPGWAAHGDVLKARLGNRIDAIWPEAFPHAHDIALLAVRDFRAGRGVDAAAALPVYLRDRVTQN